MSCKSNCSCLVCHVMKLRQEKLVNDVSWSEILKSEADSPVLSHLLRPCDSFMVELNDKFLPSICRIQRSWRAYQEVRKGVCMDCGAPFKDFRRCPSVITHDGVARCESCEKCYANDCPICLSAITAKNSCVTECGHVFHLDCMVRLKLKSSSCPMCRSPLDKEQCEVRFRHPRHRLPTPQGQVEARIREEAYDEGYEEGLSDGVERSLDALRRRGNEYQEAHDILNEAAGQGLDMLSPEEIAQVEEEVGIQLPRELTTRELAELEMMQMCEDMTGNNDLPMFVMNTVAELREAQRELEDASIREQQAYDNGVIRGRESANEDLRLLRTVVHSLVGEVDISEKEIKLLREQLAKTTPNKL